MSELLDAFMAIDGIGEMKAQECVAIAENYENGSENVAKALDELEEGRVDYARKYLQKEV
jgi:hypothetical protein